MSQAQGTPTASLAIPKRDDGWQPGPRDIEMTPSGQHMWAMTPGGTKLMFTKSQLMHLANSPLSKSPFELPPELSFLEKGAPLPSGSPRRSHSSEEEVIPKSNDDDVFEMDGLN